MTTPLTIWLLNPYHAGSHRAWAEGYAAHSRHRLRLLTMPGYFWKWRIQGGALELAAQAQALLAAGERPNLLLATSMVNLPAFLALTRRRLGGIPAVVYMHENQLTYPPPPGSQRDLTYGMIQHLSTLAADRICFNSEYHRQSWFAELPRLLRHFPDYAHLETVEAARAKAQVLAVGCDLQRLDRYCAVIARSRLCDEAISPLPKNGDCFAHTARNDSPLILWNQRWEYDKDPQTMLRALCALADEGRPFRVALAGESFRMQPAEFSEARARLGSRLIHFGYAESAADYARLLWDADIVLSTAIHEFFGVSIVEALYCGCAPVLPKRLSYPELIPPAAQAACLYDDFAGLLERLRTLLTDPAQRPNLREAVARFDWSAQAPAYDALMAEVASQFSGA